MKIWSLRHSIARGSHWKYERDCIKGEENAWLAIFRADEYAVKFVASEKKPRLM